MSNLTPEVEMELLGWLYLEQTFRKYHETFVTRGIDECKGFGICGALHRMYYVCPRLSPSISGYVYGKMCAKLQEKFRLENLKRSFLWPPIAEYADRRADLCLRFAKELQDYEI